MMRGNVNVSQAGGVRTAVGADYEVYQPRSVIIAGHLSCFAALSISFDGQPDASRSFP
jgi:hypothetical protein